MRRGEKAALKGQLEGMIKEQEQKQEALEEEKRRVEESNERYQH